ncbi:2423_t:CDS:1 [Racocetra persica]|uniref:2423_t:CDS:1 n=1 Tax=Racocetra persica TaxID=160502 RepID=A0ACA9S1Y7_9GLOM|nr:2423_t:CDS:1 [Racocetra persica]
MPKCQSIKKSYTIDHTFIITTATSHSGKLKKFSNAFMVYRTATHHYLKSKNLAYSCSIVSKLASKLWKKESENIKYICKLLADEAKKNAKESGKSQPIQSTSNSNRVWSKFPPVVNNSYIELLFNNYKRIQKLEKELSDTIEVIALIKKLLSTV